MSKKRFYIILAIVIGTLLLIASVYLFYEERLVMLEDSIHETPP